MTRHRTLGLTVGYPPRVETETRQANQEGDQPDDSEEKSYSASKGGNLSLKFGIIHGENIDGDDGARATPNPADRSGTWNPEVSKQARVALLADEVTHPMVVGTAAGGGRHGAW